MRELPILFSGEMVRAILAGTKTQTRRIKFNGAVGDLLWVREALHQEFTTADADTPNGCLAIYSADGMVARRDERPAMYEWQKPTLPSIFMPRWASRLTLEVLAVRQERLRDMTEDDAQAEGFRRVRYTSAREMFMRCWDELNGKRGYGTATNPTVYVVTFRLAERMEVAT